MNPAGSQAAAVDRRPAVSFRPAGDRFVLVELGPMELDLSLNLLTLTALEALRRARLPGVEDIAPGFRSLLIRRDPRTAGDGELVEAVRSVLDGLPELGSVELPSRLVRLPLAFDDSQTREAVRRYARGVRADAPNVRNGSNIDYVVRYNGLEDRDELLELLVSTDWWTAFMGFFPGLPFSFPLDPRRVLSAPKYNPTRIWTPAGAVGLGGPCLCVYTTESPGGYQLLGRTLPLYVPGGDGGEAPGVRLQVGDRLVFEPVAETELDELAEEVRAGRHALAAEPGVVRATDYLVFSDSVAGATAAVQGARLRASAAVEVP